MVYYFSGTGNSKYVADNIAKRTNDVCSDMTLAESLCDHVLGLVFPVYAWGLPLVVEDFIAKTLVDVKGVEYVYAIMTHGDDMGYADKILAKALDRVGIHLDAVFSVSMPNTYVCLPGFDVDAPSLASSKVTATTSALADIAKTVLDRAVASRITRGALPFTKTYVLRPLFNRFLVTDRYFRTTSPACSACGKCVRQCPLHNITLVDGKPQWQGNCTGCLRCYHQCPNKAIQFGRFTHGKGQKTELLEIIY